jgi:hypothetical protein
MPAITAKNLKVTVVLDPSELAALTVPDGQPRFPLVIRLPDRTVSADLNPKSVRKAISTINAAGPDGVAVIIQGKLLSGDVIAEAGLAVQMKQPKPEVAKAA